MYINHSPILPETNHERHDWTSLDCGWLAKYILQNYCNSHHTQKKLVTGILVYTWVDGRELLPPIADPQPCVVLSTGPMRVSILMMHLAGEGFIGLRSGADNTEETIVTAHQILSMTCYALDIFSCLQRWFYR